MKILFATAFILEVLLLAWFDHREDSAQTSDDAQEYAIFVVFMTILLAVTLVLFLLWVLL